jgi:hypothetical protein
VSTPRFLLLVLLGSALLGSAAAKRAQAQGAEDEHPTAQSGIFPVSPEEGEVVQGKPVLRVGFKGPGLDKMRFRIVLMKEGSDVPVQTWEQAKNPSAWRMYREKDAPGVACRPEEPLANGPWVWQAAYWDGAKWIDTAEKRSFIVDSIPPAPVVAVRIQRNPAKGTILVDWDPVTKNRDGGPEPDLRYRLYRYEPRPFFQGLLLNELALIEGTHWEDRDPKAIHSPTLYYVVKPVDPAGNEPEAP